MNNKQLFIYALTLFLGIGCKKSDFLKAKPDASLVVPTTLKDFQAILDNDRVMNGTTSIGGTPAFGEAGADNYYLLDQTYQSVSTQDKNIYTWAQQVYTSNLVYDWQLPFTSVFYSNVVLDGLKNVTVEPTNKNEYDNIYGSALFYRAHMFFQLGEVFGQPYKQSTAGVDLSIPLRVSSDVNEVIKRSSVQEVYNKVTSDLKSAADMLPSTPLYKTRPSKAAAFALLARVYLASENYDSAFKYANSCLQVQDTLVDYNTLTISASNYPIARFKPEVIFHCLMSRTSSSLMSVFSFVVDSNLYNLYGSNDLRKTAFFRPSSVGVGVTFRGSYDGSSSFFTGLAVDEIYLIRAECYARRGNTSLAMQDLNKLLSKRWKNTSPYIALTAADANDAINKVLAERRKELLFRGLRWTDLRRLNKEAQFATTLKRIVGGQTFSLAPNSVRYTYPIPNDVIQFNSGMQQNER
jgi:starch-binding outer membrane protein, SusD/RagB family